jgi:asparagine synthase (glutamine-hydrolysing)
MGFTSPLDEWLRQIPQENLEKRILSDLLVSQNIFNINELKNVNTQHQTRVENTYLLIWALLILEAFLRKQCK